ncbi:MAG: acetyl-CoA decarbonylase/synthase complex subunit delta, partial [Candidatus Subteraquimicrobiales bacterium]|nr:acetyl-CoA decarbonylase/synthase complex subunit delta [Candidatus Subteraquimicrobiales bacterium]
MAFEAPLEAYNGKIKEVIIGKEGSTVTVGGETALSFYTWEGKIPHKCAIAMEVFDVTPEGWPVAVVEPFKDVINDPIAWAVKCEKEYGAEMICLQLAGTDPNGLDKSPDEAASVVRSVLEKVSTPVIVYGSGNVSKDAEVMKKVAQAGEGFSLLIGPAVEDNYKQVAAAALGYNHNVAAQTPIDVNMAKQLNILITQLGLDASKIVIDPSTGALGYGIEYTYSVMERLRLAALQQNDEMTQMPL